MNKVEELEEWVADKIKPLVKNYVLKYIRNLNEFEPEVKRILDYYTTQILSHPDLALKVDAICPKCKGKTTIEVGVLKGGVFHGGDMPCPTCNGTGVKGKKVIPLAGLKEK